MRAKHYLLVSAGAAAMLAAGAAGAESPPPCPAVSGLVERSVGAPLVYLPADPSQPEACPMVQRGGGVAEFWFGIWRTDWPGADQAREALRTVYAGPPGTTVRFDTVAAPGFSWHETIRNDGPEDLNVAGRVHRTMKVMHEREGFDGNTYHSVITSWKDMRTNMTLYQNYNHIAGHPEPGAAWDPLTIVSSAR
jgi:hypothetical protein